MSNTIDTNSLLLQLRSLAQEAGMSTPTPSPQGLDAGLDAGPRVAPGNGSSRPGEGERPDFGAMIGDSLRAVNDRSQEARQMTNAYEAGHPDVELADVMVAVQKARVSFEALTQVRNRMVSAYKDIMNTPL